MRRSGQAEPVGKAAQIIGAARDAFFEQGYDAVSMDEVAKRAGVAKQTDALVLAVQERERERFDPLLAATPITTAEAIRGELHESGLELLEFLFSPSLLRALLRVTVMAVHRFPTMGKSNCCDPSRPLPLKLRSRARSWQADGSAASWTTCATISTGRPRHPN